MAARVLLGAAIATLLQATPAAAAPLVADGLGRAVASSPTPGVVTHRTASSTRSIAVAADCTPAGVRATTVALECGLPSPNAVALADVRTGVVTPLPVRVRGAAAYHVLGVGRRWVHVIASVPTADGNKILYRQMIVRRADGGQISLVRDPFGPRRVVDLDARAGSRPLCRATRRHRQPDPFDDTRYARSARFGSTVIEFRSLSIVVTRCGTAHRLRFSSGKQVQANRQVVAYAIRGAIRVRRAVDGKLLRTIPWPVADAPPAFGLTADRVWIAQPDGSVAPETW